MRISVPWRVAAALADIRAGLSLIGMHLGEPRRTDGLEAVFVDPRGPPDHPVGGLPPPPNPVQMRGLGGGNPPRGVTWVDSGCTRDLGVPGSHTCRVYWVPLERNNTARSQAALDGSLQAATELQAGRGRRRGGSGGWSGEQQAAICFCWQAASPSGQSALSVQQPWRAKPWHAT